MKLSSVVCQACVHRLDRWRVPGFTQVELGAPDLVDAVFLSPLSIATENELTTQRRIRIILVDALIASKSIQIVTKQPLHHDVLLIQLASCMMILLKFIDTVFLNGAFVGIEAALD